MSSSTLDRQDPRADTSNHPEITHSEARNWFERMLGLGMPSFPYTATSPASHREQYFGCHGCASGDDAAPVAILGGALLTRRRRRCG